MCIILDDDVYIHNIIFPIKTGISLDSKKMSLTLLLLLLAAVIILFDITSKCILAYF